METTFISIHDLSLDARLLYVSNSITDILGYLPQEVIGKSCWEYFHPDEIPFARAIHGRGVQLDKAAVLNYCKIRDKNGYWIGCECVFTIVHDVLVACTSIYKRGSKSQKRAKEAPIIRQLFSSSPRDPRYHMLTYISAKFSQPQKALSHEPRAALFLNRFTRTLTIMYATNGLEDVLGLTAQELKGKSFYYCIQENCLQEAVKCLESAKANDSIAYLRFSFRDPRTDAAGDRDEHMSDAHSSDDDDGGVDLGNQMDTDGSSHRGSSENFYSGSRSSTGGAFINPGNGTSMGSCGSMNPNSRSPSGNSIGSDGNASDAIFDQPTTSWPNQGPHRPPSPVREIELEAVVSCTSDGLVAILRAARPFLPHSVRPRHRNTEPEYANGLFASPWAMQPIMPGASHNGGFHHQTYQSTHPAATYSNPDSQNFMQSIREVAVFAWCLAGINGSLAQYSRGTPSGEAQPPGGLPVWDPQAGNGKSEPKQYFEEPKIPPQPEINPYWHPNERQAHDQWDRDSRVRHWNGQRNLLSVRPHVSSAVPGVMDLDGAQYNCYRS
ncbi:hypothetical protein MMC30_008631 [Trapelia coarctata]|nr:hypothetical protein [Trapelia coarctata]